MARDILSCEGSHNKTKLATEVSNQARAVLTSVRPSSSDDWDREVEQVLTKVSTDLLDRICKTFGDPAENLAFEVAHEDSHDGHPRLSVNTERLWDARFLKHTVTKDEVSTAA